MSSVRTSTFGFSFAKHIIRQSTRKIGVPFLCRYSFSAVFFLEASLLMLDESTDGFSQSHLEKVRTVLDEAGATQVILVSHDVELESYADRIYCVSKSDRKPQIAA